MILSMQPIMGATTGTRFVQRALSRTEITVFVALSLRGGLLFDAFSFCKWHRFMPIDHGRLFGQR